MKFVAGEIRLTRAIVCTHVGSLKTETSQEPIPMDAGFCAVLVDWRRKCPYNQEGDYVFGSLRQTDSKVTLDTYTQGLMPAKTAAQRRTFEAVVPKYCCGDC